jgi:hypothetical protein
MPPPLSGRASLARATLLLALLFSRAADEAARGAVVAPPPPPRTASASSSLAAAAADAQLLPASLAAASPLAPDDLGVVEAAHWTVNHLRSLSDSGAAAASRGHTKRPAFRRRAAHHTPKPSCTSNLMRVARALANR